MSAKALPQANARRQNPVHPANTETWSREGPAVTLRSQSCTRHQAPKTGVDIIPVPSRDEGKALLGSSPFNAEIRICCAPLSSGQRW